jgi:hypothetical protein
MDGLTETARAGVSALNIIMFSFALAGVLYIAWTQFTVGFRARLLLAVGGLFLELLVIGLHLWKAG